MPTDIEGSKQQENVMKPEAGASESTKGNRARAGKPGEREKWEDVL